MAKVKLRSGDILQIPLPMQLGFAYAKCIDLKDIKAESLFPILIRVYNYRSNTPEQLLTKFIDRGLILCPLLIAGIMPIISKGIWKITGNQSLKDEDKVIPHYKRPEPDEKNAKEWYYVKDGDLAKKVKSEYEYVKHLENFSATGSDLIGTKIAMALIHDEGKRIEDYFELKEYFEKVYFEQVTKMPPYYKQPEYMRGKAIGS